MTSYNRKPLGTCCDVVIDIVKKTKIYHLPINNVLIAFCIDEKLFFYPVYFNHFSAPDRMLVSVHGYKGIVTFH